MSVGNMSPGCCNCRTGTIKPVATIPDCFCTAIPQTLAMTSYDESCNYGMFRTGTIQWQPTPDWAATLNLGPNIFLGTTGFADPIAGGALFYYYLTCHFATVALTRLYPTSPYGSPYRDGILYQWIFGNAGDPNYCGTNGDGFRLDGGAAFPGSDASCNVHIDG